ncbi:MAG: helix-hairpin-helix domain-containing protein [bacterium]|nr:helix-hairpin-helix domain-containing protein [bacterium]
MGKELIALLAILLMTAAYSFNNSAGLFRSDSSYPAGNIDSNKDRSGPASHLEIVRDGAGRIYPLNEAGPNYIVLNGEPLEGGDRIEYINPGNQQPGGLNAGQIRRGRMKGQTLLLFGMPINLNEASIDDLTALPGIGVKTAEAIVRLREEKGPFKAISEIMNVRGIGKKKFNQIREKLTL